MKLIRTISSLMLVMLVLVSSTSFTIGMHFCMGEIQDMSMLTKATPCPIEQNVPPCHKPVKASCCADEQVVHSADDLKISNTEFHFTIHPVVVQVNAVLLAEIIPTSPTARTDYYQYDPPFRSPDIIIEHQVFLI